MTNKVLALGMGCLLFLSACSKKDHMEPTNPGNPDEPSDPPVEESYTIKEDFESGKKTAYAAGDVALLTGSWNMDDALIGNLATDAKNGNQSVRIREGSLTMNFDINGIDTIIVSHAKFGSDAASEWQLMVSEDAGANYTMVGEVVKTEETSLVPDTFLVDLDGKLRFKIQKTGTSRINIDDFIFKGKGDPGITIGTPDPGDSDDSGDPGSGSGRGTPDGSGADVPPAEGENSNLFLGNPSNAQASMVMVNNYLIDMKYYAESYSSTNSTPNWVSWHLDASNITRVSDRLDNFAAFTDLPTGWYQVQSTSYSGSGFDRGHNCPSADRTSSREANSATFLMANMIPQAPNNNQQTWSNFENYLRTEVVAGNEVYIIMGSYGTGGSGSKGAANTIDNGKVNVPAYVWKVAVILPDGTDDLNRIDASTRVIAINTPNTNNVESDWKKYVVSVQDIEMATNYNLLSALPQSVQEALKTKKDQTI